MLAQPERLPAAGEMAMTPMSSLRDVSGGGEAKALLKSTQNPMNLHQAARENHENLF